MDLTKLLAIDYTDQAAVDRALHEIHNRARVMNSLRYMLESYEKLSPLLRRLRLNEGLDLSGDVPKAFLQAFKRREVE